MFHEIAASIAPGASYAPYPPAADRKAWEGLPNDYRERLIQEGERYLHFSYPPLSATDYMDFCRTGDRNRYQDRLFLRRTALNTLVLAECCEYEGRFLDDILNGIYLICEENAWQLPAHNSYIRDTPQLILPDVTRPVIDLFAAETGAVLATVRYLLKDALDRISPAISVMIQRNLRTRIFTPYLKDHFWWMGGGDTPLNNWTPWCTQNVLLAAFLGEEDRSSSPLSPDLLSGEERMQILQKACLSLDEFLDGYGEDGCCNEGAQYYRHAGLTLFNGMEVLNAVCPGAFSGLYQESKIKNIASYIMKVHIAGPYYVNFADCSPIAGRCNAREFLFAKRTNQSHMMAFAARDYMDSEDPFIWEEHNLFYRLQAAFCHEEMLRFAKTAPAPAPLENLYFPSAGLFLARNQQFSLAVKAGCNGDSHNHNDVGSFTIYKDGSPLFIDVGVETYTQKTFSPRRYEIWTMQSRYHNLPSFGEIMQKDGLQYRAEQVEWELSGPSPFISMDLTAAYPTDQIRSYRRKAALLPNGGICITDIYDGELMPAVLSLMTYEKPEISQAADGSCLMTIGNLGQCRITGASSVQAEEIPITDQRLQIAWKHNIWRTLVTMKETRIELNIC